MRGWRGAAASAIHRLRADRRLVFSTPDRQPRIRFATNAHILTRGEFAGLPIEAVNAQNLTARILRVDDAKTYLTALEPEQHALGNIDWLPQRLAARLDDVVWRGDIAQRRPGAE